LFVCFCFSYFSSLFLVPSYPVCFPSLCPTLVFLYILRLTEVLRSEIHRLPQPLFLSAWVCWGKGSKGKTLIPTDLGCDVPWYFYRRQRLVLLFVWAHFFFWSLMFHCTKGFRIEGFLHSKICLLQ
jgi:hypothetical protein